MVVALAFLFYILIDVGDAYDQNELEWDDMLTGTMQNNGYLIVDNYKIKVVDFPPPVKGTKDTKGNIVPETPVDPYVMLDLYDGPEVVERFALTLNESHIYNDAMRFILKDIPPSNSKDWVYQNYNPWAEVTVQKVKMPNFDISIKMEETVSRKVRRTEEGEETVTEITREKTAFGYNDNYAEVKIEINNTGSNAKDIDVLIYTEGLRIIKGRPKEHYYFWESNKTTNLDIGIEIPKILQGSKTYNITVVVSGYDIRGKLTSNSNSKKIIVGSDKGMLEVVNFSKTVKDIVYLGDKFMVTLTIQNNGNFNIDSIVVDDSVPDKFEIVQNITLNWKESVLPGKEWEATYLVKPLEYGTYRLSPAKANITIYGGTYAIESNEPLMDVYGPKIVLIKSGVLQPDNTINVKVRVMNAGSIPTTVSVRDEIPESAQVLSGETHKMSFLDKSGDFYLTYSLKIDNIDKMDYINLSKAVADFNVGEFKDRVFSNAPSINLKPIVEAKNKTFKGEEEVEGKETFNLSDVQKDLKNEGGFTFPNIDLPKIDLKMENIIPLIMLIVSTTFFVILKWDSVKEIIIKVKKIIK